MKSKMNATYPRHEAADRLKILEPGVEVKV
jgi:hypothetical protein